MKIFPLKTKTKLPQCLGQPPNKVCRRQNTHVPTCSPWQTITHLQRVIPCVTLPAGFCHADQLNTHHSNASSLLEFVSSPFFLSTHLSNFVQTKSHDTLKKNTPVVDEVFIQCLQHMLTFTSFYLPEFIIFFLPVVYRF